MVERIEPQVTRDAILRAAVEIMARRGYTGTNLQEVAARFGVTRQALYYHFASKDEILYAVFTGLFDRLTSRIDGIRSRYPPHEHFRKLIYSHTTVIASDPAWAKVAMDENRHLRTELQGQVLAVRASYLDILGEAYSGAVEYGALHKLPPDVAVRLAVGPANWMARWYNVDGSLSPKEIADMVDGVVFSGLRRREPSPIT